MPAFLMNPMVILGIALGLSILVNVGLWKLHSHDLQKIGELKSAVARAVADAKICSDGVDALRKAQAEHDKSVLKTLEGASRLYTEAKKKSQATIMLPPQDPTNACTSAELLNKDKLKGRREIPPAPAPTR